MGGGAAASRVSSAMAVAVAAAAALVVMWAGTATAAAAVYEVGDKTGWTIMGSPNYTAWAASKKFHLGDTVVFTYNKQFHNVMAVSKSDYKNCNTSKPIATWSTGNDSVVLNATGHHYFLCGFPGHCGIGQKVDIRVAASGHSSAAPSMAPAPASGSEAPVAPGGGGGGSSGHAAAAAPSPHGNAAVGRSVFTAIAVSVLSVAAAGLKLI
ncbi:hypothetical protein DAI22_07g197500 [Oryza sativa Japonica Group]|nr:hypothetical protein DAI22_07g197500 [Oryza sativa Japonica Group]